MTKKNRDKSRAQRFVPPCYWPDKVNRFDPAFRRSLALD